MTKKLAILAYKLNREHPNVVSFEDYKDKQPEHYIYLDYKYIEEKKYHVLSYVIKRFAEEIEQKGYKFSELEIFIEEKA